MDGERADVSNQADTGSHRFQPPSEIAFNYAVDRRAREGAAIHLLHVLGDPP